MSDDDTLVYLGATRLVAMMAAGDVSCREVLEAHLLQIERHNPTLNAIVALDASQAVRQAKRADAALAAGQTVGPLHGVPMTLKDCHPVAGLTTTAGIAELAAHVPTADGPIAQRLRRAGAIVIGHTNVPPALDDYQTSNQIYGRSANPWDPLRTPGGSSGGAAAALAAGMTPLEIGSDLAGSIRLPAHMCGVYGLKPTRGLVPTASHIPDLPGEPDRMRAITVIGPMARDLDDLERALGIIADAPSFGPRPAPVRLGALRLAWAAHIPHAPLADEIAAAIARLASTLEGEGVAISEALPPIDFRAQGRAFVAMTMAVHIVEGPGPESAPLAAGFVAAWDAFFEEYDALLCPVAMCTAFAHVRTGSDLMVDGVARPYWHLGRYLTPFSLSGHPALAMPLSLDLTGLPIGLQVVTRRGGDNRLLAIGRALLPFTSGFVRPPGY